MPPHLSRSAADSGDRLVRFEAEWNSGQVPDVAGYLRQAGDGDREFIENLIEVDLECRWKQFDANSDHSARDPHGFPLFPQLDDYASVLPPSLQQLIFTPHCVAEEYRVRSLWGDKPKKESFLERFPEDKSALETALQQIETEFKNEGVSVTEESSRSVVAPSEPTVILGGSTRTDSTLAPESELIGTHRGKYRLESRLGNGAFGEVWKAYDPGLKRQVAIKFPRRDKQFPTRLLETFRTEAQKLAKLGRISGVVSVFDCGEHDGKPYFVSDYIEGESLANRMQRKPFSHREAARLIARLAETLKRAHQQKLVHRDIKPANILLDTKGEPYIADFGMAATDEEQLSEKGGIVGTYAYMAPEQARGDSHRVDGRADIYALGVILYRLLTNELPYGGKTTEQFLDNIQHQKPRPPRQIEEDIPPELERICLKCLKKDEDERYLSAGELAKAMRAWDDTKSSQGLRLKSAVFAALFLSLLFFTWKLWPDKPTKPPAPAPRMSTSATIDLLTVKPKLIMGVMLDGDLTHYDPENRTFAVRTKFPSIFQLGDRGANTFEYTLTLDFLKSEGEFGIVWGISESNGERTARVLRLQHADNQNNRVQIKLEASSIRHDGTDWSPRGGHVLDYTHIPAPNLGDTAEIIIGVKDRNIRYAFVNQQPVTFFADLPDEVLSTESAGALGVYSSECESHVKQATFSPFSEEREAEWKASKQENPGSAPQ